MSTTNDSWPGWGLRMAAAFQRVRELERDLEAVRAILKAQELADGTARRAALLILDPERNAAT